jgi:hypothetical protein
MALMRRRSERGNGRNSTLLVRITTLYKKIKINKCMILISIYDEKFIKYKI